MAEQAYDDAVTANKNAQLQLLSARAALQRATSDLNYSLIKAPFDGTLGISQVRIGTLVSPGQTLLNTISTDDPMAVDFEVNAAEYARYRLMEKEHMKTQDSTFRLELADGSVYPRYGKISIIDRAFDPQTATITVRLTFSNKDRVLKPGMSCNVLVYTQNEQPQIVIPYKAVNEQMGEYFVFKVSGGKATEEKVSLGRQLGSDVIVTSGVAAGDIIVTNGIQKLHNGSLVQTETAELTPNQN